MTQCQVYMTICQYWFLEKKLYICNRNKNDYDRFY